MLSARLIAWQPNHHSDRQCSCSICHLAQQ